MKTPAVTIVAAWISAETGVGPSIASGSQVCRPICADFPIAPMNSRMQARSAIDTCQPRKLIVVPTASGALANTVSKSSEPKITKTAKMPSAKPKSPTRLTMNALIAAALAVGAVVPEADQQVRAQADAFPAEEQLHEIVGRHQHQHEEGEQAQIGHEARDAPGHAPCSRSSRRGPSPRRWSRRGSSRRTACRAAATSRHRRPPARDPGGERDDLRLVAGRGCRGTAAMPSAVDSSSAPQVTSCDAAVADRAGRKAGDDGGEQRQEDDGDGHRAQPSSC